MAKIEELKKLDLDKIKSAELKQEIQKILDDFEQTDQDDMKEFLSEAQPGIDIIYDVVQSKYPDAIPGKKASKTKEKADSDEQPEETDDDAEAHRQARRDKSKKTIMSLSAYEQEIADCRQMIKEYNKKKREAEGHEPKPKKSRLVKLKDKLLGIATLIPASLKDNKGARDKTEKILLSTLTELKKAWNMNVIKVAQDAIKEKFDQMEGKGKKAA